MAAYGALVSLMYIIDQIQNHPCPPIFLHKAQVKSLSEMVNFLQKFLEGNNNSHVDYTELESRVADAAYASEDVIESHIVDRIHAGSTSHWVNMSSIDLYDALQKVIEAMDSIKKEAMEIKEKRGAEDQPHRDSTRPPGSSRSSSNGQNIMVGFDDALLEIMDKLTGGQPERQIIPIVGMGGMGKTTLARNVYANPLIKEHFDICAWATISQEYDVREILGEILGQENKDLSESELGEMLHKHLWGRRYLIVMDDMWSIEAWDEVSRFLPDNKNGSKLVITTRLSNLAFQLTDSYAFEMKFLDEDKSWKLFCKTVFGEECCPLELEEIAMKIAENCRGLPLSIVVIGGHLAKSKHTLGYWEYIAKNLYSLVNSEDDERCLKILYMSYKHLPVHLKPCFLYMGVFPEDRKIRANMLQRLWAAEGFLKPVSGKSLEEVAEEYLEELINRNLVQAWTRVGKIKYCNIHDLLRDLCLREAERERFYINVMGEHSFKGTNTQRRIVIHGRRLEKRVIYKLQSMSLARSLICPNEIVSLSRNFMLLRIVNKLDGGIFPYRMRFLENMFQSVNSRYLVIRVDSRSKFPGEVKLLWNLHTLVVDSGSHLIAPSEIWEMPQLRHVKFRGGLYLPDPPSCCADKHDNVVLSSLQSLSKIMDFKCGEEVLKKIPYIKKLRIQYSVKARGSINNLDRLHKLKSFRYKSHQYPFFAKLEKPGRIDSLQNLSFPHSLKKLNLDAGDVLWDDIMKRVGSLPLLEVLKLRAYSFGGCIWETVEGQFCSLKFLKIEGWTDLEHWKLTESTHLPCLEQLVLRELDELKEIPSSIGEIPTLQAIEMAGCSDSIIFSAKKIQEEQEKLLGEVAFRVRVILWREEDVVRLKSLASPTFQLQCKINL